MTARAPMKLFAGKPDVERGGCIPEPDILNWTCASEDETMTEHQAGSAPAEETSPATPGTKMNKRILLGAVLVILIVAGAVWFAAQTTASSGTPTSEGTTSISSEAGAIIASAVQTEPAGFVLQTSEQAPSGVSGWATLQHPDGSEANVTVMVYSSIGASQAYYGKFVAGVEGLPGYTDITSDLSSFQQYGKCYGYGEDVDGIAVVNGVCTKGNAFLQVHLVSAIAFSDLEADLTGIMGALYRSAS